MISSLHGKHIFNILISLINEVFMITMIVILVVRNTEEETGIKSQQIYLKTTLINSSSLFFQFKDLEVFILEA